MTDQELQQIARKYVEQNPPADIKDEVLKKNYISLNAEIFEKFLIWLTKTHCIVSREKVRKLYQLANCDYGNDPDTICTLEYIFGKSTFEERSEQ